MPRTRRFNHPILEEVAALDMPHPQDIVIGHSAALSVWGIDLGREPNDIDLTTSPDNLLYLQARPDWQAYQHVVGHKSDGTAVIITALRDTAARFDVHEWDFSAVRGRISLADQKEASYQDEATGIYVATPEYVRETKLDTGRPKDERDIIAIDKYLKP